MHSCGFVGSRRADERRKFSGLFAENECACFRIPVHIGSAQARPAIPAESRARKLASISSGCSVSTSKLNHSARLRAPAQKKFRDRKRIAGIDKGRGLRANDQRADQRLGGQCAAFDVKGQMKVAQNFQRINPASSLSGFVAEKPARVPTAGRNSHGRTGRDSSRFGSAACARQSAGTEASA